MSSKVPCQKPRVNRDKLVAVGIFIRLQNIAVYRTFGCTNVICAITAYCVSQTMVEDARHY